MTDNFSHQLAALLDSYFDAREQCDVAKFEFTCRKPLSSTEYYQLREAWDKWAAICDERYQAIRDHVDHIEKDITIHVDDYVMQINRLTPRAMRLTLGRL